VTSLREVVSKPTVYDVASSAPGRAIGLRVLVGRSGLVGLFNREKTIPREKTAATSDPEVVYQLREMGLEDSVAAKGHRFNGLRAFASARRWR